MAGLIPYIPYGGPSNITNLDELIDGGLWRTTNASNRPSSVNTIYWLVDVRKGADGDILQIAKPYAGADGPAYTRVRRKNQDNTWTEWS